MDFFDRISFSILFSIFSNVFLTITIQMIFRFTRIFEFAINYIGKIILSRISKYERKKTKTYGIYAEKQVMKKKKSGKPFERKQEIKRTQGKNTDIDRYRHSHRQTSVSSRASLQSFLWLCPFQVLFLIFRILTLVFFFALSRSRTVADAQIQAISSFALALWTLEYMRKC